MNFKNILRALFDVPGDGSFNLIKFQDLVWKHNGISIVKYNSLTKSWEPQTDLKVRLALEIELARDDRKFNEVEMLRAAAWCATIMWYGDRQGYEDAYKALSEMYKECIRVEQDTQNSVRELLDHPAIDWYPTTNVNVSE